ncbi:MAG: HAD family hydrolase [Treponema sp.]
MFKAVIFDLDDTLYDYESIHKIAMEKLCVLTCKKIGVSEVEFYEVFSKAKDETKKLVGNTAASHNRMLYFQKALEIMGKNPVENALEMYDCYWNCMLGNMKLRNGTIMLLNRLISDGIKIALCTDLTAHIQQRKIKTLGLAPYIDVLVTSEEAGEEKPGEKMYSLVFEKLQALVSTIAKSDCLFTGDSQKKDVDAPRAFGMKSVLFTDMKCLEMEIYGE